MRVGDEFKGMMHTVPKGKVTTLWTPTREYLEWLEWQHPRMTADEMRDVGWLRKSRRKKI